MWIHTQVFSLQMTHHNVGALVVVKPGEQKSIAGIITERGNFDQPQVLIVRICVTRFNWFIPKTDTSIKWQIVICYRIMKLCCFGVQLEPKHRSNGAVWLCLILFPMNIAFRTTFFFCVIHECWCRLSQENHSPRKIIQVNKSWGYYDWRGIKYRIKNYTPVAGCS